MKATVLSLSLAAAAAASAFAAGDSAKQGSTCAVTVAAEKQDIVETALAAGSFKTLAAALQAGELVGALKGKGPFTVFAPTDEAFARLPEGTVRDLLKPENRATLQAILSFHVVPGEFMARQVVEMPFAPTLNGQRVSISMTEGEVRVQGAKVLKTDISCSNGVIHVIDSVILPNQEDIVATAVAAGSFKTLAAALQAAGLVEALQGKGPFTVFAPSDEAFARLPEGTVRDLLKPENKERLAQILKFHVVSGRVYSDAAAKGAEVETLAGRKLKTASRDGGVWVGSSKVVKADIETSNGVIHVIDAVMLP
jgi:transforming growth factor-beta-induced protein